MTEPASKPAASTFEYGTDGPRAIVVGVDGSEPSLRAAAYAAGLARRQHSKVVAVYVRRMPGTESLAMSSASIVGLVSEAQRQIEEDLRRALSQQRRVWQVDAELLVREGDPLDELVAVAKDIHADAIVVGASASFVHRHARSLAVRLVRQPRYPVTVVP